MRGRRPNTVVSVVTKIGRKRRRPAAINASTVFDTLGLLAVEEFNQNERVVHDDAGKGMNPTKLKKVRL